MAFSTIEDAIAAVARGEMIIVVDDESRENEGDLVIAGDAVDPAAIAFMMNHARGLVCVSLPGERLDELEMPLMVRNNSESMKTAFTVSVDLMEGISTGISAADRARTIRALVDPTSKPDDFARPGHIFPLRANPKGVLGRPGHTEAAVDLCRLAGRTPCGVICEIAKDDGTMARVPELEIFAEAHGLHLVTIEALIEYRRHAENVVEITAKSEMPTPHGRFEAITFTDAVAGVEHVALVMGDPSRGPFPVRIHSECLTGEAFGSLRCDCGDQLEMALSIIGGEGAGCLIYMRGHEGRGIGLGRKIEAYGLQDSGLDTVQANKALGLPADARDYTAAASLLTQLGVSEVVLLTNNPDKVAAMEASGIVVKARRGLIAATQANNVAYLTAKREKFGHFLEPARALEAG
ncbi:bifunctional 3,4-dihydroxy-2-butanone-4-phosphate synthase/GTP cyclohydrolase II [Rhizobium sp. R693]|uniref:bifunctional 3,4-dihydroxy-2-butanone-4-phosphate synthase/GTP cyclohydrolase II n=1 Tax=Rhizobium sp. R693 TaxID=1764276 RepID=UPI000B533124|nr:bifunctional 3,4-dihydroxy-2-butanone-4-phosphate synthase/GTP cyclohydrolase II [Rhizobium sp. R693]OWV98786.1 3,4-dihydroxy-2-butanone 4-phosphate synthase [Rhizobium sp. R693]